KGRRPHRGEAPTGPVTRVVWAPQAIEDVEAIRTFVARDSPHLAELVAERIFTAVTRLEEHPLSGRVVPEIRHGSIREIVQGNYRIMYRLRSGTIQHVPIVPGARMLRLALALVLEWAVEHRQELL